MKSRSFTIVLFVLFVVNASAQDFVTRARIEFEKKESLQRRFAGGITSPQIKDQYPEAYITYYDLLFAGGESLYRSGREVFTPQTPGRSTVSMPKNNNVLYFNFNTGQSVAKRNILQEEYVFDDSVPLIKWKIGQETRKIAGYECRKAIGRIFDTVYLVAFYAEELVIKGGPEGFQGLPGMILGLAIPRYNTTWFATKVELANFYESLIQPPALKGKKISKEETKAKLIKKYEQMGVKDPTRSIEYYFKKNYFL